MTFTVGHAGGVHSLLPQLRRGSGQHLAVSISVLQKWWRSGINCTYVMSFDMAAFFGPIPETSDEIVYLYFLHLATTNVFKDPVFLYCF